MGAYPPVKTTPTVLGYEAAGVISAVGDSVQDLAVGGTLCAASRVPGLTLINS